MNKLLTIIIGILITQNAFAINRIDITRGNPDPLPIAISEFIGASEEEREVGAEISRVISADLERSGLFKIIDKAAYIDHLKTSSQLPKFSAWRQINAQGLAIGKTAIKGNEVEIEFRLWDPFNEKQVAGKIFTYNVNKWRRVAHKISDEIYKALTGEDGYFDTRIVYVAESGPALKRIKRIASMDSDGENHRFETDGKYLALTPRFSPNANQILYLSYASRKPRVYIRDLYSGREKILGDFPGMTYAPRYSPDGNNVIMSAAYNGNSDIYEIDLK
ncbi:MAG: Tol-Pal system protein TolB, partial [Alphaproteobacteria bacterium]